MPSLFAQLDLDRLVEWIARFNLFGLPIVLALVLVRAWLKAKRTGIVDNQLDRQRTILWIGLLNFGLALRDLLTVIPALKTRAEYENFGEDPLTNLFLPAIAVVVHTVVGLGVRRLKRWARWVEVVFNVVIIACIALTAWFASYGAAFDPGNWPDQMLWYVLPFVITAVMLFPGTVQAFRTGYRTNEGATPRLSAVSMVILGFLVILAASLLTNGFFLAMLFVSAKMQGAEL